jgi:hypothetical protein
MEMKKPYTFGQEALYFWPVQKIHKGRKQGRPVPQLILGSEENCKMVNKSGTISAKLCALQCIFCVQDTKYKQSKVQELHAQGRKVLDVRSPESLSVTF